MKKWILALGLVASFSLSMATDTVTALDFHGDPGPMFSTQIALEFHGDPGPMSPPYEA